MIKHLLQFSLITAIIIIILKFNKPPNKWEKILNTGNKTEALVLTQILNKPDKTATGNILLAVSGNEEVLLIDQNSKILHKWQIDAERARLLPNGNILVIMGSKWGEKKEPWMTYKDTLLELNPDNHVIWEYQATDDLHHDFNILPNNNLLLLKKEILSQSLRKPEYQDNNRWDSIRSDTIFEINRNKEVLWEWQSSKHLDINTCGRRPCIFHKKDKSERKNIRPQDWTHLNTANFLPENKWYQQGHSEFKPGNIITIPRNFWEAIIIDKASGKVVWRYGEDSTGGLIFGHEAQMITAELPGAGNVLIFDNGGKQRQYSIIKEINPITKEIVWSYSDPKNFFSPSGGSMQRLENGNTFISGDNGGNIFEVTATGEIVWQIKSNLRINRARKVYG